MNLQYVLNISSSIDSYLELLASNTEFNKFTKTITKELTEEYKIAGFLYHLDHQDHYIISYNHKFNEGEIKEVILKNTRKLCALSVGKRSSIKLFKEQETEFIDSFNKNCIINSPHVDKLKNMDMLLSLELGLEIIKDVAYSSLDRIINKEQEARHLLFNNSYRINHFANNTHLHKLIKHGGRLFEIAGVLTTLHLISETITKGIIENSIFDNELLINEAKNAKKYIENAKEDDEEINYYISFVTECGKDGSLNMAIFEDLGLEHLFIFLHAATIKYEEYLKNYERYDNL